MALFYLYIMGGLEKRVDMRLCMPAYIYARARSILTPSAGEKELAYMHISKAVNREAKLSRRYRDRDLAKFERSRRYRER
jgi:hypothetical protein